MMQTRGRGGGGGGPLTPPLLTSHLLAAAAAAAAGGEASIDALEAAAEAKASEVLALERAYEKVLQKEPGPENDTQLREQARRGQQECKLYRRDLAKMLQQQRMQQQMLQRQSRQHLLMQQQQQGGVFAGLSVDDADNGGGDDAGGAVAGALLRRETEEKARIFEKLRAKYVLKKQQILADLQGLRALNNDAKNAPPPAIPYTTANPSNPGIPGGAPLAHGERGTSPWKSRESREPRESPRYEFGEVLSARRMMSSSWRQKAAMGGRDEMKQWQQAPEPPLYPAPRDGAFEVSDPVTAEWEVASGTGYEEKQIRPVVQHSEKNSLKKVLKSVRLTAYEEKLKAKGVTYSSLLQMSEEVLKTVCKDVDMKPGHTMRFVRTVQREQQ
uniref:SAM domain-containing protein n=1 Tax=Lotharella oceanica TaxID=641309 RepID=A0A7S2TQ93_9EUKA|mmetsp:Transcript_2505/g.4711  ORF Transcript_2505/g.4711 Transcript_2505/m.4711 type:complete len:385 (+) Transcript_2505:182-1336(+)